MENGMLILEILASILLKPKVCSFFSIKRIGGCFFLSLGGGIGFWFLFQSLVPLIGYLQSGTLMSVLFLGIGGGLLLWNRKKKPESSIVEILGGVPDLCKGMDMEKMMKNNIYKILLVFFVGGILVSQMRNGKKLSHLKDKLPQLNDFLRQYFKS